MLRVLDGGPRDAPPVVLLHGQPGSPRTFDTVVDRLDGLRTLAVERPGWGTSPLQATGFAGNARTVGAWLQERGLGPSVVVGHSWGAGVALTLAVDRPELVAGLVLVAPVGARSAVTVTDRALALPVVGDLACRVGLQAVGLTIGRELPDRFVPWELEAVPRRHRAAVARTWRSRTTARAFVAEQQAFVREAPGLADRLGEVAAPALVLAGRQDRVVAPRHARDLADALLGARLEMLDGGHLLHLQRPAAVAAAVRELLHP